MIGLCYLPFNTIVSAKMLRLRNGHFCVASIILFPDHAYFRLVRWLIESDILVFFLLNRMQVRFVQAALTVAVLLDFCIVLKFCELRVENANEGDHGFCE